MNPTKFLPLTAAEFQILLSLAGSERHGYAIMQDVEAATGGQVLLRPGTLYRSIKKLLDAGLIEESEERPDPALDDERRRYYLITGLGRRTAEAETKRLAVLLSQAHSRLGLSVNPNPTTGEGNG